MEERHRRHLTLKEKIKGGFGGEKKFGKNRGKADRLPEGGDMDRFVIIRYRKGV